MKPHWKRQAGSISPDYEGNGATLREQAHFAREALVAYSHGEMEADEAEVWVVDLLADLMHLCDQEGWDFRTMVNTARRDQYLSDINGEPHEQE